MDFFKWDTPLQAVLVLLITGLCIFLIFFNEPANKSAALNVEFKNVNFVTEDDLNKVLTNFKVKPEEIKVNADDPQFVTVEAKLLPAENQTTLPDINKDDLNKSFQDNMGRVRELSLEGDHLSVSFEKNVILDGKIRNTLKEYGLENSFISHSPDNPMKIEVNCGKVDISVRGEVKDKFAKNIGEISNYEVKENGTAIKLGLDLRSGTHLRLQLLPNKELGITEITPQIVEQTIMVLERRINDMGTFEPIIQKQGDNSIIIDLPEVQDPKAAIEIIQKTAFLEFKEQTPDDPNEWKTVMTGDKIKSAQMELRNGPAYVSFVLTPEGTKLFAEITERNIKKPIAIYFDGKQISAPIVESVIAEGSGRITMGGGQDPKANEDEALKLARFLRAGALPVPIQIVENQLVGPTLGKESLDKSLHAGIIGLVLVCIFMIVVYRVPGLLADIALIFYALVLMACFVEYGFVLTLPGIAGFILSIGMAVDANVLIFERLREELWEGKTVNSAIGSAFHRAWTAVFDTHVTTFIGAVTMYYLGSSSIRGFGLTLALGTAISLITAVFVTRVFVDVVSKNNLVSSRWLYGE